MSFPTIWPAEQTAQAQQMWLAGVSASVIGRKFGVSRSAVIGKMHRTVGRLDPAQVKQRAGWKRRKDKPPKQKKRLVHKCVITFDEPDCDRRQTMALEERGPLSLDFEQAFYQDKLTPDACRWINGDVSESNWFYCGAIVRDENCPYCAEHAQLAYYRVERNPSSSLRPWW